MNKPIKKISIILFIILLLPLLFFGIRELTTISENERIIEEIYANQLEAILFSVNQYSEDVVRTWVSRFTSIYENNDNGQKLKENLTDFFSTTQSLKHVSVLDSVSKIKFSADYKEGKVFLFSSSELSKKLMSENSTIVERLLRYRNSNYFKIEPIISYDSVLHYLIFVLGKNNLCIFGIDKEQFTKKNLSSQIQSVSREQFIVNITDDKSNKVVYETERTNSQNTITKGLWLIPDYLLGIQLKGKTISGLISERAKTDTIIFIGFGFLMLVVAYLAFRNIKREVELAQMKSDFVSNVSHELRTPLSLISMFAETLEMNRVKSDEKRKEYYGIISHESNRLSRIVNSILSFSQIEAGKKKYNFSDIDLNKITEKIYETYNYHLTSKGFTFLYEPMHELPIIEADGEAISESIINLIDNAIKYSNETKLVIMRTGVEKGCAIIEVEDNGIGISKSDQQKIFDKFYRAAKGLVHNTKGTGLGLTLVKHIVEAHKGKIELYSEVGKGSRFCLSFPIKNVK